MLQNSYDPSSDLWVRLGNLHHMSQYVSNIFKWMWKEIELTLIFQAYNGKHKFMYWFMCLTKDQLLVSMISRKEDIWIVSILFITSILFKFICTKQFWIYVWLQR